MRSSSTPLDSRLRGNDLMNWLRFDGNQIKLTVFFSGSWRFLNTKTQRHKGYKDRKSLCLRVFVLK
jgi:hypothetical protein